MIHHPPPSPPPTKPAVVMTINTTYFDPQQENAFVNLRGIKGTLYVNACAGREMHIVISKHPGQEYGTVFLQCKGDKQGKVFYLK